MNVKTSIDLKQLKPGDSLTVTIERFNNKYLGETTLQGKAVVVPGSIPGETIRGEVVRNWKRRLLLKAVEIIDSSRDRATPQCKHFTHCAGCQFQHIDYQAQLKIKESRLRSYFDSDHPATPLPLRGIIGSPTPYRYRNSIKLHGPGEPGFWQVLGVDMMRNQECPICVESVDKALQQQREKQFQDFTSNGILNVLIRGTKLGEVYIGPENPQPDEIAWLNEELTHPLTGVSYQLIVPAHAFWQGSTPMLPTLVEQVVRPIQEFQPDTLIESYCGMGLFGIMSAPYAREVIGIEEHPLAIEAAKQNQENLDIENLRIFRSKTEDRLGDFLAELPSEKSSLIVDPPRSGLPKKVLKQILATPPQQLVYVSCSPESFARNLHALCRETYQLQDVVGLDLFPQTKHLECVGVLERRV
ncbi:class I SAM-dependent RNA methyltransferase [Euhalothece natronophila Z-M001]|uniref:Class I SAM-dependent RNA methyltransferase n=1 Tax=Euhalothece natronophila Z-M001 TaxID=522448 RepID=A0A5B8NPN6_9CHRO|nr:class I SAM-dependent RNA methyltransferase [Euhalothece natronophila]QDZ41262.1 class I SAM-dependent RNA methyltransferase [Euhalothece natronophila Z-M001]